MAKKIQIEIIESTKDLEKLYAKSGGRLQQDRLKVLLYLQKRKYCYQSDLAKKLGRNEKTIREWLKTYAKEGLSAYLRVKSGGNNTRTLSTIVLAFIAEKLQDAHTNITSYVELQTLIETELGERVAYGALYSHCRRKYKAKLKVARKSHHKKAENAELVFKKN